MVALSAGQRLAVIALLEQAADEIWPDAARRCFLRQHDRAGWRVSTVLPFLEGRWDLSLDPWVSDASSAG